MQDVELVERARGGDRAAWAALWDAHGPALHRYAYRLLGNEHDAGDVVADTFVSAAEHLHELREADRLGPWLYAIARRHVQRRWASRDRVRPLEDDVLTTVIDSRTPVVSDRTSTDPAEAAALLWAAADGLGAADRDLLALVLSADLDSGDVAAVTGEAPSAVYVRVSRLKETLGRAAGALLVARHHREDCDELEALLAPWDGVYSPLWRKRIARHVDACGVCGTSRRGAAASLFSVAGMAPLLTLPLLEERAVDGAVAAVPVSNRTALSPEHADAVAFGPDGWPVPCRWPQPRRRRRRAPLAAVAALIAVALAVPAVGLLDDHAVATRAVTSTPTATPSPSGPLAAPEGPVPALSATPALTLMPVPVPTSGGPAPAEPQVAVPAAAPEGPPPAPAPPPVAPAPPTVGLALGNDALQTACGSPTTTEAVAEAAGSGIRSVTIRWDGTAPEEHAFPGPGPHRTAIGPFSSVSDADGSDTVTVVATVVDERGRTATATRQLTVQVAPC